MLKLPSDYKLLARQCRQLLLLYIVVRWPLLFFLQVHQNIDGAAWIQIIALFLESRQNMFLRLLHYYTKSWAKTSMQRGRRLRNLYRWCRNSTQPWTSIVLAEKPHGNFTCRRGVIRTQIYKIDAYSNNHNATKKHALDCNFQSSRM